MIIEQCVFERRKVKPETLDNFGFTKRGDSWFYSEPFYDGEFLAEVEITANGQVKGKVWDIAADEEYTPVRAEDRYGAFVGTVRESYRIILNRIAEACFDIEPFRSPQMNRLADSIFQIYGESFDHPFEKSPEAAAFRYPQNRKWYGLVMDVPRKALTRNENDSDARIEILNLKVMPDRMDDLLTIPGIYPAYHMKHTNWISVLTDDTVSDEKIMELIDQSRSFAVNYGRQNQQAGPSNWIIPANPRYYDVENIFKNCEENIWKQGRGIKKGDTVFLYVASPVSAVRFKCVVTECEIPFEFSNKEVSMTHVMRIKLLETYPKDLYKLEILKKCGVKTVRGPIRAPEQFMNLIKKQGLLK